jgi:hypothetical protein
VPLLPVLAVLAAIALIEGRRRIEGRAPSAPIAVIGLVLLLGVGEPAWRAVRLTAAMRPDTRAAARDWLLAHACSGERVLLEGALTIAGEAVPAYVPVLPATCNATYVYSLERNQPLLAHTELVVATSFMYERFLRFPGAPIPARRFYEEFFRGHQLLAEIAPTYRSYAFHNPTIRIYRLRR